MRDLCELLERFERRGVALVSVAESLDTGSAAGRLVLNIMAAVSQWEREAIGERTRDALKHKRANGERVGNVAYGSRLADDGVHVEDDPGERAVLAEICRLRSSGTKENLAETKNFFVLYLGPNRGLIVPKRFFQEAAELEPRRMGVTSSIGSTRIAKPHPIGAWF